MINIIISLISVFLVLILSLHKKSLYINSTFFFIFLVYVLGTRGFDYYPIALPGLLPPFSILLCYVLIIRLLISNNSIKAIKFKEIPIKNLLIIFIFIFFLASVRGLVDSYRPDLVLKNFLIFAPTGLIYFIILSFGNYEVVVRKYINTIILSLVIISIVYFALYSGLVIKGGRELQNQRIVWGGVGGWIIQIMMIIFFSYKYKKLRSTKSLYILLFIFGLIVIIVSQTRTLMYTFFLTFVFVVIRRGLLNFTKNLITILIILVVLSIVYLQFFGQSDTIRASIQRVQKSDDVLFEDLDQVSTSQYYNAPHKLKPLLYSFSQTKSITDFLFGHGFGFTSYLGRVHYHSGLGWVYGSMGIIGIIIIVLIFFRTIKVYSSYITFPKYNLNSILIEIILAKFIVLAIMSPIVGALIQSFSLYGNALGLSILEVCRRNLVREQLVNK